MIVQGIFSFFFRAVFLSLSSINDSSGAFAFNYIEKGSIIGCESGIFLLLFRVLLCSNYRLPLQAASEI